VLSRRAEDPGPRPAREAGGTCVDDFAGGGPNGSGRGVGRTGRSGTGDGIVEVGGAVVVGAVGVPVEAVGVVETVGLGVEGLGIVGTFGLNVDGIEVVGTVGIAIGGIENVGTTGIGTDGIVTVGSGTSATGIEPGVALGRVIAALTSGPIPSNACNTSASTEAPRAMRTATRQPASGRALSPARTSLRAFRKVDIR
jgi:hypothetical protein